MENQISNIITILTALLTGGFLMLFIENQQITTYVIERLHQRMNPFFHSFMEKSGHAVTAFSQNKVVDFSH